MTPTEAIASIRASIAAGYSPSLSDIEVLIAECGRVRALEGQIEALKAHEVNFCMKHGGYGQSSDCASCKEIARAENKPDEPEVEMRMGSPVYGPGCSCVEEINPLDEILNSRKAKALLTTQSPRNENG